MYSITFVVNDIIPNKLFVLYIFVFLPQRCNSIFLCLQSQLTSDNIITHTIHYILGISLHILWSQQHSSSLTNFVVTTVNFISALMLKVFKISITVWLLNSLKSGVTFSPRIEIISKKRRKFTYWPINLKYRESCSWAKIPGI